MTTYELSDLVKKLGEEEFFNSNFMSIGMITNNNKHEIVIYLYKKINSSNLPAEYEGVKVSYQFMG